MYVCVVWTIPADLAGDVCGRHLPPNLRESSRVCAGVRVKVCGRRLRVCVCAWYVCERHLPPNLWETSRVCVGGA